MKINYNNTALGLLSKMNEMSFRLVDDGDKTTRLEKTRLGLSIVREWHKMQPAFSKEIRYMSKPFYQAYEKSVGKLAAVLDAEPMHCSGTLVFSPAAGETNTIFYDLVATGKENEFRIDGIIMVFTKLANKDKPALSMLVHRTAHGVREYISKKASDNGITDMTIVTDIYTLLLFIKYCDIETKVVCPKNRRAMVAGEKYINETTARVTILDATWFTNLVVSGQFEVGGHLHWYWTGPNRSIKRLQWVDSYTKNGYTRKAKAIIKNETNG